MMSIPGIREPERKNAVASDHVEAVETELEKIERETREKEKERERRVAWLASAGGKLGLKAGAGVVVGGAIKDGGTSGEAIGPAVATEEEKVSSIDEAGSTIAYNAAELTGDADEAGWGIESEDKA